MWTARQKDELLGLLDYADEPIRFFTEVLDVDPGHVWPKMQEIVESVRDNQFTAVPAGHSVSKTYTAARIALWFKCCYQPSTVITTAPSDNQVRNQLWREIHTAYQGAKWPLGSLGGRLTTLTWDCVPDKETMDELPASDRALWEKNFAIGFSTTPDSVSEHATRMQGWHNEWLLVILDEACGILPPIWRAVLDGLITNERCKVLAIGNPTDPNGMFEKVCKPGSGWNVIQVSVRDTPNYQKGREIIPHIAGRDFEHRIISEYGQGSNEHKYRCLGEFPLFGEGSVFGQSVFEYQQRYIIEPTRYGLFDYNSGTFVQHEGRWGWKLFIDGPGSNDFSIGIDSAEHRLSDQQDPMSQRDYDAMVIYQRNTKRVVGIWYDRRGSQTELGLQVLGAAKYFNNAWVCPEIPAGIGILRVLLDNRYGHIFNRQNKIEQSDPEDTENLGWRTTTVTRQWLINDLRSILRSNGILLQFQEILDEMATFRYDKTGKPIHASGRHDDLIFALAMALQADLTCPKPVPAGFIPDRTGDFESEGRYKEKTFSDLAMVGAVDDFDEDDDFEDDDYWHTA